MESIVVPYLNSSAISLPNKFAFSANIYPYLTILILLPVTYISFLTYTSMKGQMILMREANSEAKEVSLGKISLRVFLPKSKNFLPKFPVP